MSTSENPLEALSELPTSGRLPRRLARAGTECFSSSACSGLSLRDRTRVRACAGRERRMIRHLVHRNCGLIPEDATLPMPLAAVQSGEFSAVQQCHRNSNS